jgi:hypothetical protein
LPGAAAGHAGLSVDPGSCLADVGTAINREVIRAPRARLGSAVVRELRGSGAPAGARASYNRAVVVALQPRLLRHRAARSRRAPLRRLRDQARGTRCSTSGAEPARLRRGDSRFGPMFFSDPAAAFVNIGSALDPKRAWCCSSGSETTKTSGRGRSTPRWPLRHSRARTRSRSASPKPPQASSARWLRGDPLRGRPRAGPVRT